MGKLVIITFVLTILVSCSNTTHYSLTGQHQESHLIDQTLQSALEYNPDGVISYWSDKSTGKSGHVKPLYASYKWKGPCRNFEIAYFYADNPSKYYYGVACRHDQVWQIH